MRVATTLGIAAIFISALPLQSAQTVQTELNPTNGASQQLTHICSDNEALVLTGSNNRVALTGLCRSLMINGSQNIVTADNPLDVDVVGDNNTVTWPKIAAEPHIRFNGNGNRAEPQKH